ncbi:LacI family transcriptional regulator [Bradyrhizobium sp. LTSP885]|uniref:LacI family DNA-binding transcriptional regulator n=1 Tax=Bradyrhizobium sp. LTSP885 TaxID=1619232 RepID=UPI0005C9D195|nr:LacI family DNA-binding transcriptional regulator [Bradyrhizobium sp. LTSP885]KJC50484.1 LacI family transcriptional regulator [Bradyrhizobium sp. LTSP885]
MSERKIRNMEDFARASGISRPTVSKYFNDPSSVRQTTRGQIERALREFDYRPNLFAVNLNRRRPKNIGVIVPHISDPFYAGLVQQIETRALQEGYWAIVLSSQGDRQLEEKAVQTLLALKLSGAVMAPLGFESDPGLIDSLRDRMPLVFMDSRVGHETPFVGTDNLQSVSLMVAYLCRTGESPCYLDMPPVNRNAIERKDAYIASMQRLGKAPIVLEISARSWEFEAIGFEETNKILDGAGFPTRTVLCANDRIAFGAMAAAYQRGMRIGRENDCDLRIAGHDDHPLSRYACPALTTVSQDYAQIARTSLDILLQEIQEEDETAAKTERAEATLLEAKLIMRESA